MLKPYPTVEIVFTTSWLQTLPVDAVISYLPPELALRVVDTTKDIRPRLSYEQSGAGRPAGCYRQLYLWETPEELAGD